MSFPLDPGENSCSQILQRLQEQQGTNLEGLSRAILLFPFTHTSPNSPTCSKAPLAHPPSPQCLRRVVYNLEPQAATPFQNYPGSDEGTKRASRYLHIKDLAATASAGMGEGRSRTRGDSRDGFCVGGAPRWDFCQCIYRAGRLQFLGAFIIPAQHKAGFTSPSPSPRNPSQQPNKVSATDWCQTQVCWWKVVVFAYLFFYLSLHYP